MAVGDLYPGDKFQLLIELEDADGPADPDPLTATMRDGDGTVTNLTLVNDAVGKYHSIVQVTVAGRHDIWVAAGEPVAKSIPFGPFFVKETPSWVP